MTQQTATQRFEARLAILADTHAHPVHGFFGPGSMTWHVNREGVVYLGGLRALLMQIAHPKVAQGVADHSDYRRDPLGRLFRTFDAVHRIVYGTRAVAIDTARAVRRVHTRVRGVVREPVAAIADPRYQANDPELLMWVYATLVDSAIAAYYRAMPPLREDEWERYYQESKVFARLFGVPESRLPETLEDFRVWMDRTVASPQLTVTDTARDIARFLIKGPSLLYPLRPSSYILAAGTLPPKLRDEFGLRWSLPVRTAYSVGLRLVQTVTPRLPPSLRTVPVARRAQARCSNRVGQAA